MNSNRIIIVEKKSSKKTKKMRQSKATKQFKPSKTFRDSIFNLRIILITILISPHFPDLTDDDVVGQSLVFILGGLNAIAGTACFMFHELSLNPDIQDTLFAEINGVKNELNGAPLTYESIAKMKYLDMVVCETLRRWCPVPFLERTCTRPYVLENNEEKLELQVGDGIFIPTYALHMDEKYFPKPIKFNPERFNDVINGFIRTGTYLPFGIGSRMLIFSLKIFNLDINIIDSFEAQIITLSFLFANR